MIVSDLLEQSFNKSDNINTVVKSDNINKFLTACSKLVDNLGQTVRTQLVDGLLADLLQDARFLRVYMKYIRKNAQVVTNLQ
jgi:acid stress-induced BolA-like protein IbaG/YrbA